MSRVERLIQLHKRHHEDWGRVTSILLGYQYEGNLPFKEHVFAYNHANNAYGQSLSQGYDYYLLEGGLCLDSTDSPQN